MEKNYAVVMKDIVKRFGDFYALKNMQLKVEKGTIHSILGENGAGKSTLMNVLYGLYSPEHGEIFINGKKLNIKSPKDAINNGIGMVHQHFMLVENFTVTENIILGSETVNKLGIIDRKKARQSIVDIVAKYGLEVDPDAVISNISVGMQQRVEILKALYRGAEILILDEPTSVLTPQEIEELAKIMDKLTSDGKTIIIITHKLKEIKASSDTCTIVRRGEYVEDVVVKDVSEQDLARLMVGHDVKLVVDKTPAKPEEVVFEIKDLHVKNEKQIEAVKGLNLQIRKGEIVGIAGIDGNGQKELVESIINIAKAESGEILINGKNVVNTTPKNVIKSGISTIPEDRHKFGLVLEFICNENSILKEYDRQPFSKKGILNRKEIEVFTKGLIEEFDIRPENCATKKAGELSGGNQQKLIIAREVATNPDLLIAFQPTRGLDVGAIETVHKTLIRERDKGKAVLLISYELDEVMNVSDTVAVIYDGQIVDSFKQGTVDENTIGLLMAGGKAHG